MCSYIYTTSSDQSHEGVYLDSPIYAIAATHICIVVKHKQNFKKNHFITTETGIITFRMIKFIALNAAFYY